MKARKISKEDALMVACILEQECRFRLCSPRAVEGFTETIAEGCEEYRFQGALGFGGKFRNNSNNDNTPYVDCYPEDETPERERMIAAANRRLAEFFANPGRE